MNIQKFIISGIVGGVASFFMGWLVYGFVLMSYMNQHAGIAGNINRPEMIWWALILGNLFSGLTLSYIFNKWANITSIAAGAFAGAVLGLLFVASYDFTAYGTTTIFSLRGIAADIVGGIVLTAVTGAAVAWANSWGNKA
jgi:uncharacterized membrane protein